MAGQAQAEGETWAVGVQRRVVKRWISQLLSRRCACPSRCCTSPRDATLISAAVSTPRTPGRDPPQHPPQLRGHPNILKLHAAAFAGAKGAETDGFLLVDHCPDTLLAAMQRVNFALDERAVVAVFSCVALGIAHMHRQSPALAHRWGGWLAGEGPMRTWRCVWPWQQAERSAAFQRPRLPAGTPPLLPPQGPEGGERAQGRRRHLGAL
jgi:hypothetical protein